MFWAFEFDRNKLWAPWCSVWNWQEQITSSMMFNANKPKRWTNVILVTVTKRMDLIANAALDFNDIQFLYKKGGLNFIMYVINFHIIFNLNDETYDAINISCVFWNCINVDGIIFIIITLNFRSPAKNTPNTHRRITSNWSPMQKNHLDNLEDLMPHNVLVRGVKLHPWSKWRFYQKELTIWNGFPRKSTLRSGAHHGFFGMRWRRVRSRQWKTMKSASWWISGRCLS